MNKRTLILATVFISALNIHAAQDPHEMITARIRDAVVELTDTWYPRVVDTLYGGWYETGLDHSQSHRKGRKAHHWKTSYHNLRALLNCEKMLTDQTSR